MIVTPNYQFFNTPSAGLRNTMRVGDKVKIQGIMVMNYTIYTLYIGHGSDNDADRAGAHFLRVPPRYTMQRPIYDDYINWLLDVSPTGATGPVTTDPFLEIMVSGQLLSGFTNSLQ